MSNPIKALVRGACIAAASLALWGVGLPTAQAQQGVTDKEIVIGGFGPLTGPLSWLGQGSRDGTQLAVDEINEHGGINGRISGSSTREPRLRPRASPP